MQKKNVDLSIDETEGNGQDWKIKKLADEASLKDKDEIQRQILRGDETKGNPDNRDNAGTVTSNETPHGREETKNDAPNKANTNG